MEGKCIVFDDSFEHEAWNNHPSEKRINLIIDIWHPDLSDQEVTLLNFLEKAKMNKAKRICSVQNDQNSENQENNVLESGIKDKLVGDNFYALLEYTRNSLSRSIID